MEIFNSPCFSAEVRLNILFMYPYLFGLLWGNDCSLYPPLSFPQECENYAWKFEVVSFLITTFF